ncbi:polyamine aminopropyltransferase [Thalassotalea ponticola]|uniref:polyamine aminopropyltransferase n=1 Tax=Thalassotalea ponticola TaxID=1523392 RepID=UPI0025B2DB2D|nr:polyamine aminopropyltransferase [Thalassotalea ponticola]MDN3651946.1 polyamine aminopropyltransferase [Thalassotalea ponticola]
MRYRTPLFWDDVLLILTMAVLAGCGLIYEYLLSHYAGRVLGVMESTIYAMIGLMIVAMGLGSFAARLVKDAYQGFVVLELVIGLLGCGSILIIASFIGFTQVLPQVVSDMLALPQDVMPNGGVFKTLTQFAFATPYVFGFILGFFIGMEIPLVARIREQQHQQHLTHNFGTMYGADYIGAGIGAAVWVGVLLTIDIANAAALTASLNLLAGSVFIYRFWHKLKFKKLLILCHALLLFLIVLIYQHGNQWLTQMSNLLFLDKVSHSQKTRYQQLTFTERNIGNATPVTSFYLNARLQFSSNDEFIYHEYLVTPALLGSARQDKVLIIGGGDGLALRNVLKWPVSAVTLIDLDAELVDIFSYPEQHLPPALARRIESLTQASLRDERVTIINDDAYVYIDQLLAKGEVFDAIIVDLPDPSHPDLNKLYSVNFYARLKLLLAGDGLINIQSTSPYHAKKAFISIGKTVARAGFAGVEQLHANVPSFGEWGWTIASKQGAIPSTRLQQIERFPVDSEWLTPQLLTNAFAFPKDFYQHADKVQVNYLGSHQVYQYHQQAWQAQQGLNNANLQ